MLSSWRAVVVGLVLSEELGLVQVALEYRAGGQGEKQVVVEQAQALEALEKQVVLEYEEQGLVQVV